MTASPAIHRQRALATERQRLYRARRRTTVRVVAELERPWFIDALIDAGRLDEWNDGDLTKIASATIRLLEDWAITVTRDISDPVTFARRGIGRSNFGDDATMNNYPAALCIRVPAGTDKTVAKVAAREGKTPGEFVRGILNAALSERGIEPDAAQRLEG
jgi:hypothetical protein